MSTSTARVTRSKRKRDEEALLPPPAVPVPAVPQYEELPPPKAKRARKAPIKKASGKVFEDTAEGSSSGAGGSGEDVRLAKYKPKCPQVTQERIARVMSQRFFMIDRMRENGELKEEFKVLGSTGNVYTVIIDRLPSCDCPDAMKGNHCKHILFVYLKVLNLPLSSAYYYQKALLSTELAEIFASAPANPADLASQRVRRAFLAATNPDAPQSQGEEEEHGNRRIPDGDDCPVCYEEMHAKDVPQLVFCEECGNGLHKQCFGQWARTAQPLTCVYCRTEWRNTAEAGGAGAVGGSKIGISHDGYVNLSGVAGVRAVRDTSTYHYAYRHRYY